MQIDLEHLHFWMCAIRESKDPKRTLDAFWRGQMQSKEWLIEKLRPFVNSPSRIEIHGGWVGTLASMIFQSGIPARYIASVDIDPDCEPVATMMNKPEEQDGRFRAITADMCSVPINADVIINTSCEHLTQDQYDQWISRVPADTLVIVQSNNYRIDEHIRTAVDLEEFKKQSNIKELWSGSMVLPMYTRFMIIGYPNVSV